MATDTDTNKIVVDLLVNNWNATNTDNKTPEIRKLFQFPKNDIFQSIDNDTMIGVYNPTTNNQEVGIGNNTIEDVFEIVKIDLRHFGDENAAEGIVDDTHIRKVRTEIDRILKTNKISTVPFDELRSTQQWIELNDRYRGIFRYVKEVELVEYCRDYS